jgi:hypothetical protein
MADICSGITHVDAEHWASIAGACTDLVDRKVRAAVIGSFVILGSAIAWNLMSSCMNLSVFLLASRFNRPY